MSCRVDRFDFSGAQIERTTPQSAEYSASCTSHVPFHLQHPQCASCKQCVGPNWMVMSTMCTLQFWTDYDRALNTYMGAGDKGISMDLTLVSVRALAPIRVHKPCMHYAASYCAAATVPVFELGWRACGHVSRLQLCYAQRNPSTVIVFRQGRELKQFPGTYLPLF